MHITKQFYYTIYTDGSMRYQGNAFPHNLSRYTVNQWYQIYQKGSYIKKTHILAHVTSSNCSDRHHSRLTNRDAVKLEGRQACTCFHTARTEKRWKAAEMSKKNQIKGGGGIKTIVETAREKKAGAK